MKQNKYQSTKMKIYSDSCCICLVRNTPLVVSHFTLKLLENLIQLYVFLFWHVQGTSDDGGELRITNCGHKNSFSMHQKVAEEKQFLSCLQKDCLTLQDMSLWFSFKTKKILKPHFQLINLVETLHASVSCLLMEQNYLNDKSMDILSLTYFFSFNIAINQSFYQHQSEKYHFLLFQCGVFSLRTIVVFNTF